MSMFKRKRLFEENLIFYDENYQYDKEFIISELKNSNDPNIKKIEKLLEYRCFLDLDDEVLKVAWNNPYVSPELFQLLLNNRKESIIYKKSHNEDLAQNTPLDEKMVEYLCNSNHINLDMIKYLVRKKLVDINRIDDEERNALHCACANKNITLSVIEYLVEQGVDLNKQDEDGYNPIHVFIDTFLENEDDLYSLNQDIIKYLVNKDVDLNVREHNYGQNILHYICSISKLDPITIITVIQKSQSLNTYDMIETSPLDLAYKFNNLYMTIFLLLSNKEINLHDFDDALSDKAHEPLFDLITAAKKSRDDLEKVLEEKKYLRALSPQCLIKLATEGFLSEAQLIRLKEQRFFSTDNVKYFSQSIVENVFTYVLCMKKINDNIRTTKKNKANNLQLNNKVPKPLINQEILKHILFNAVNKRNDNASRSESGPSPENRFSQALFL